LTRQSQKNKDLVIHVQSAAQFIWYVNGIVEGYDGLGVVRTIDKEKGLIEILSTPDQEEELRQLLSHLSQEIGLVILD
jgi:polynucleotide 5'-kinase involved in rRNA processing